MVRVCQVSLRIWLATTGLTVVGVARYRLRRRVHCTIHVWRTALSVRIGVLGLISAHFLAAAAGSARAQIISPGKLAAPHAHLEGMTNCTHCHELRQPGITNDRCLRCHEVLGKRIAARHGLHASFRGRNCAECHKEHFGPDFQLVRHDTVTFKHAETGFTLRGAHLQQSCRDCHRAEFVVAADVQEWGKRHGVLDRTYLGLGTVCTTCHGGDDPHGGEFGTQACDKCHSEDAWKPAPGFDHRRTRYALDGRHLDIACAKCHSGTTYRGLRFATCTDCHEDPHRGSMEGSCTVCHSTTGWALVNAAAIESTFDHARTRFALVGAHANLRCASCHDAKALPGVTVRLTFATPSVRRTYPAPAFERCESCHIDVHRGQFRRATGGAACDNCHESTAWLPTTYTVARHDKWPLEGAHAALSCGACHDPSSTHGPSVRMAYTSGASLSYPMPAAERCTACHVDLHAGEFADTPGGPSCDNCHGVVAWAPTTYGLDRHERWSLTGAHVTVACSGCHTPGTDPGKLPVFKLGASTCAGCHASSDPHADQFGERTCDDCHNTNTFELPGYDHSQTRYPLDGAHRSVPCASCHLPMSDASGKRVVRYRGVSTACRDCHGGRS